MRRIFAFVLLTIVASFPAFSAGSATASCDRWKGAWAAGTSGSTICDGHGNSITVSCRLSSIDEYEDTVGYVDPDGIYYRLGINFRMHAYPPEGNKITLIFDRTLSIDVEVRGGDISNYHNLCPSCMSKYNKVIDLFKKHKKVTILTEGGESATFTLRGAAETIPDCEYELKKTKP